MGIHETIVDLAKHPHNFGELPDADLVIEEGNQSCGDVIKIFLKINDGAITDVRFKGLGCAVSLAATSLLTDYIKNKTVDEAKTVTKELLLKLLGTEISAGRLRCALLPLEALKKL
jgi:nitrogen fixation NifU-like protein